MLIFKGRVIIIINLFAFLGIGIFSFSSHAVWLASNTPELTKAPYCVDLLTRIQFTSDEENIIQTFHENGERARFFDPVLGLRYKHPLKKRGERISYIDQILTLFLKLDQSHSGNYYVAMMGPSIFTVKKLNNQLVELEGEEQFVYQVRYNRTLPDLLNKFGVKTSLYYSDFVSSAGQTYILKEYTPGPTIEEVDELFLRGEISREKWIQAHQSHIEFMSKLGDLENNQKYIDAALELNISIHLDIEKLKIVYFKGQWVIDQF